MQRRKKWFQRIALWNRGEPAIRFIQAIRDLNREEGQNIQVVAFYTEPDQGSMFTVWADECHLIGPAMVELEVGGEVQRKSAYLDYRRAEELLRRARVDALWPGWGFAAEAPEMVELCDRLGITFIGPSAEVMRKLGDKISSKQIAEESDVPVTPWSGGALETLEEAKEWAQKLGFPLALKASAGGGGRGIRLLHSLEDLEEVFEEARSEALKAFGDSRVFLERLVSKARHVEVQIAADLYGKVWAVGLRDCSVQRRNQKVIEETPSPVLSAELEREICDAARRIAEHCGYTGLGTAEFLYDPEEQAYYFMEMNTRLQVEHPITEEITGLDLVKLQVKLAMGEELSSEPPRSRGHAIEVRLNAEDPEQNFAPTPGRVKAFVIPTGPGIRCDTGIREGDHIPMDFDSMVAKIIAYGETREEARARLDRALTESVVLLDGGQTNKGFLLQILRSQEFQKATLTTGWIDELQKQGQLFDKEHHHIALLVGAITLYQEKLAALEAQFFQVAEKGRPLFDLEPPVGVEVSFEYDSVDYTYRVCKVAPQVYRLWDGEQGWLEVGYTETGPNQYLLHFQGNTFRTVSMLQKNTILIEVEGIGYRLGRGSGRAVIAPMPTIVLRVHVKEGDVVREGDRLATLEAMKMEIPVYANQEGKIAKVLVTPNTQVGAGEPLFLLEGEGKKEAQKQAIALPFTRELVCPEGEAGCVHLLREMEQLFLGFDLTEEYILKVWDQFRQEAQKLEEPSLAVLQELEKLLRIYFSQEKLFTKGTVFQGGGELFSSETMLFTYLSWIESGGEGLPEGFKKNLLEALSFYGITSLQPSEELREALFFLFRSHLQLPLKNRVLAQVFQFFLEFPSWLERGKSRQLRRLIHQLSQILSQERVLFNLARQVLYALFDSRLLERRRRKILRNVERRLQRLRSAKDEAERVSLVSWMSSVAPSLLPFLSEKMSEYEDVKAHILEVLTRRLYRNYQFDQIYHVGEGEEACCISTMHDGEKQITTVMSHGRAESAKGALANLAKLLEELEGEYVVADLILVDKEEEEEEREVQALVGELQQTELSERLKRVCFLFPQSNQKVRSYTFVRDGGRWKEVELLRHIHPSVNRRLELWRFENFRMERLKSGREVYVFRATSKVNENDQRLFVIGEIRDLAPIRNERGEIVQLPHVENVLFESFEAIREELAKRENPKVLNWNRVILYIWPPVLITKKEVEFLAKRLAPFTEGLDLEKVVFRLKLRESPKEVPRDTVIQVRTIGDEVSIAYKKPERTLVQPLSDYDKRVIRASQRNLVYPYELIKLLTQPLEFALDFPPGEFQELDLRPVNGQEHLVPVKRPFGQNEAAIVVGRIKNYTKKYPEGLERILLVSDCTRAMGSLAEPECKRIIAALDLAERENLPLEWYAISSGAKISMDSGTENLDWTARVLRRIVEFTQRGGFINIIVDGINVGAQSYWNAEATMLMHTKGCLIMTPKGAMVLTGKQALDYSGGVSAEDNIGIGGFERIMGPNGEAQYYAPNLVEAYRTLFQFYDFTYAPPTEVLPRRQETSDPVERDICECEYKDSLGTGFTKVGDIFDDGQNPGRKKPFHIRQVMFALKDQDSAYLERWRAMKDAEIAVVWDTHLGGFPVCLIGIESHPIPRFGHVPSDGPEVWTGGTLFPLSSKKVARAINSASGNRPVVILANLSGFDGSPESLRKLQLEYGAEIGRAVVNYGGPLILFVVISRYHGGAYVVFSKSLSPYLYASALEGSYASVIGGAPAAAVVFPRLVRSLTLKDERIVELRERLKRAKDSKEQALLQSEYAQTYQKVYTEKLGEVAAQFDSVHTVERAKEVGSLDEILPPQRLRPFLVEHLSKAYKDFTLSVKSSGSQVNP